MRGQKQGTRLFSDQRSIANSGLNTVGRSKKMPAKKPAGMPANTVVKELSRVKKGSDGVTLDNERKCFIVRESVMT